VKTLLAALAIILVGGTTACTSSGHTSSTGSVPSAGSRSESSGSPNPDYPTVSGKVAIYADVTSTNLVADGHSFRAQLVLVNGLGVPISYQCSGWLAVGLSSSTITFQPGYEQGCVGKLVIPIGVSRRDVTVLTTYTGCSQGPNPVVTPTDPACLSGTGNPLPPLPAGIYHLRIDTANLADLVVPKSVAITLTKP
jgi:hypothetical protein